MIDRAIQVVLGIALALSLFWGTVQGFKLRDIRAEFQQYKADAATNQANALAAEIKRSNETIDQLRANHAKAEERAARAESEAAAASAAADSAGRMARRVRDASETSLLAARAKIEAAGATASCGPALDAATVREGLLQRCLDIAQGLGNHLRAVAKYSDDLKSDDAACRADYATVIR